MQNVQPTAPSLLTVTAPQQGESTSIDEADFAEQLAGVTESPASEVSDPQTNDQPDSEAPTESPETSKQETASEPTEESSEQETSEPSDSQASQDNVVEEALLAVTSATETIVLASVSESELPTEDSTPIDATPFNAAQIEVALTEQPSETSAALLSDSTQVVTIASTTVDVAAQEAIASSEVVPTSDSEPAELAAPLDEETSNLSSATSDQGFAGDTTDEQPSNSESSPQPIVAEESASETTDATDVLTSESFAHEASASTPNAEVETENQTATDNKTQPPPVAPAEAVATKSDTDISSDLSSDTDPIAPTSRETPAERTGTSTATERAEANDNRPTVDPARFVSRVSRAIDSAQQRGGGPVEMRLSPPELGTLQVKIEVKEGVMTASLDVETPAARNALLDNLPALRDRLEQQQIRIEKFDVDVRDDSQQRGGEQSQSRGEDRQPTGEEAPRDRDKGSRAQSPHENTTAKPTAESSQPQTISFDDDGLNLVA